MFAIVDLAMGNIASVGRALSRLGIAATVVKSPEDLRSADKVIMPGVGHFGAAMKILNQSGISEALNEAVVNRRVPILGICLGMELMARTSEEGNATGLGWIDAQVMRFEPADPKVFKVPHMGWNTVEVRNDSRLLTGVSPDDEFYFAHAYHLKASDRDAIAGVTSYESDFDSVIERGNIFGVQFHPEKSHEAGLKVLRNFADI